MDNMKNRFKQYIIYILISLPILSLVINEISWLRFGVDIPIFDDWRPYNQRRLGSLNLAHLFYPANDTLYPVGQFLDSLAFRHLNGNSIAYQFISMLFLLGTLLLLQWKLLLLTLRNHLLTASAFSLTLLMLQPDTYWGLQDMAYHQALPLICILPSIYITLRERWNSLWNVPMLMVLGFCSGLSYISGSFSILLLSIIFFVASFFTHVSERPRFRISALSLFIPGLITTLAQLWVIIVYQKGTHVATPMAFPIEKDFWIYLFGKVGRSLMLPIQFPLFSFITVIIFICIVIICFLLSIKTIIKTNSHTLEGIRGPIIYISISSVIFIYLLLVAAGRTHYRPDDVKSVLDVFIFGFHRFHFFWVTILWPWLIALFFYHKKEFNVMRIKISKHRLALIMPFLFIPVMLRAGVLNHVQYHKSMSGWRVEGFKCLLSELQKGSEISCKMLFGASLDFSTEVFYGKERGASFTRLFPFKQ